MKKTILIATAYLLSVQFIFACDVCGCKLGGLSVGLLPQFDSHYIGLRYTNAKFNAALNYNSQYISDEYSEDTYQTTELISKIRLNKKFSLSIVVPYMYNKMDGTSQKITLNGIGDPIALLFYKPIDTKMDSGKVLFHTLMVGVGEKFPVGKFKQLDNGTIINRNFQLGTGSSDYLASLIYTLKYKSWGLNIETSYKYNQPNNQNYTFGNQTNASFFAFKLFEQQKQSFLPYIGAYYESSEHQKNGNIIQSNSGGEAVLSTYGLQYFKGNYMFNAFLQNPIYQNYNSDAVATINANNRFSISCIYNFGLKKIANENLMN